MCGIVGYIGNSDAVPVLLSGLSRLEYRGYDSSGIALHGEKGIIVKKAAGTLDNLITKINSSGELCAKAGIGHTRWATHGKPNEINAHPHSSSRYTIVHNGIIENERSLKDKYLGQMDFVSDTDTEVIVRLLQLFSDEGESTPEAIRRIIAEVEGSYALAIMDRRNSGVIYAVKNKSPLLIGSGTGFNMVGSDAMAMLSETNSFYEIEDREYAVITADDIKIYTSYGMEVRRNPYIAEINITDAQKGTYPHYMLKEIEEQPAVVRRIISEYTDKNGELCMESAVISDVSYCDKVYIIACGTSYHAGLVGKEFFEKIVSKPADVFIASEFVYNMPILSERPLFVFISQSGETADCRAVLVKIKSLGYKSLTITNVKGSTLSREAEHTLLLHAGPEIAVASTKAYTAQIALLAILAAKANPSCHIDIRAKLSRAASVMESLCLRRDEFCAIAHELLQNRSCCFYIGRGIDYYVCLEAALKLKEISYIHTEGFAAGELKHGTIALIENDTPVIAITTQENTNLNTRSNIKEVKARGANVVCISTETISSHKDHIVVGDVCELLTPLVSILPAQYIAYYAALEKGCDIDKPRNLAKSVTVE